MLYKPMTRFHVSSNPLNDGTDLKKGGAPEEPRLGQKCAHYIFHRNVLRTFCNSFSWFLSESMLNFYATTA